MTSIMIGHKFKSHRIGTVYGNYTLNSIATDINASGSGIGGSGNSTIYLPVSPSSGQLLSIKNTGTGTVTVSGNGNLIGAQASTTLATGITGKFYWDGYTWGCWFSDFEVGSPTCAASIKNATHDFGTTTQGPAETPYTVPPDTIVYSDWWVTPCGETVRRKTTTDYTGRSVTGQWKTTLTSAARLSSSFFTATDMQDVSSVLPQTEYGATLFATLAALNASIFPASFTSSTGYGVWTKVTYTGLWNVATYTGWGGDAFYFRSAYNPIYTSSQLTLYYLDTNIIWEYETL